MAELERTRRRLDRAQRVRGRPLAALGLALVVAAACVPGASASSTGRLHAQARAALDRWAKAVAAAGGATAFVLVGDPTGQIGDWEEAVGDNDKRALMAGAVEVAGTLPAGPGEGQVVWSDGTTATEPLLSAADAVAAIRSIGGTCADCRPLGITGARLTSVTVETNRGRATAPAWEFTLAGTSVRITRVAVADRIVSPVVPTWDPYAAPAGLRIDAASVAADGRTLTVSFIGAVSGADRPCGSDYTAEAVESSLAVVVIVTEHPNRLPVACVAIGHIRTAAVTLAAPLGNRAVLDVVEGLPVRMQADGGVSAP